MSKLAVSVTSDDHIQGDLTAGCILVEYGDYECPSCGDVHPTIKRLQKHFGKRLCFAFRNFPLSEVHPWAEPAAEVAEYADVHGKFWEMHDLLFENQENLDESLFYILAGKLGLLASQLQSAVNDRMYTDRIQADFTGGVRSGVNGTPTFFISGQRYDGAFDYDSLIGAINHVLQTERPRTIGIDQD